MNVSRLKEVLVYNPENGDFYWRQRRGRILAGTKAGCIGQRGISLIRVDFVLHKAHRLAWLYMTGQWPQEDIDHRDGNPTNNRWENLREATDSQNLSNMKKPITNTSGRKGVSRRWDDKAWQVHIRANGKSTYVGSHTDLDEAHKMYADAARKHKGEFARFE